MVLEMLLDGDLNSDEQIVITNTKYLDVQKKAGQILMNLEKTLTPETRAMLEAYLDCIFIGNSCVAEEYLEYGFALGVRLMKEAEDIPYFKESA